MCCHVVRRDGVVSAVAQILSIVCWPHPLIHVMRAELSRTLEEVCDNHVVQWADAADYARTLLDLVLTSRETTPSLRAIGFIPPRPKLEDRFAHLLDARRRDSSG